MKIKKTLKFLFYITLSIFTIFLTINFFTNNTVAYANDDNRGGEGDGDAVGSGPELRWVVEGDVWGNLQSFDCPGSSYGDGVTRESLQEHCLQPYDPPLGRTSKIAYVVTNKGINDGGNDCYIYDTNTGAHWDWSGNWSGLDFPLDLTDTSLIHSCIPVQLENGLWYDALGEKYLSAVWVDINKLWIDKTETNEKTVYYYIDAPDDLIDPEDQIHERCPDSQDELEYAYYNYGSSTRFYDYETKLDERTSDKTIIVKTVTIQEVHTWKEMTATGETKDHNYTYTATDKNLYTQKIKYNITGDINIIQEKYKPLSLNRNNYVTSSDSGIIDSSFINASTNLEATVNNNVGVTDGSSLESLDINNDFEFSIMFDNSSAFGMPSEYNWDESCSEYDGEKVTSNSYCNGHTSSNSDGCFRDDLTFNASMSKPSSYDTSSIKFDSGDEITSSDAFIKEYRNGVSNFTGGECSAKFSLTGNYTTDNTISRSEFKNWWVNSYTQSKLHEYGVKYWGIINVTGISEPELGWSSGGIKTEGDINSTGSNTNRTTNITTNLNSEHKGVWISCSSMKFEQPVLYGKWDVDTIAGNTVTK